jgi:signal transduction histidine kinase
MRRAETESPSLFEARDRAYAGLRVAALGAGLAYAALLPAGERGAVAQAMGGFAAYSALLYGALFRILARRSRKAFYFTAAAVDLGFAAALIAMTGGAASPFLRALYLWVAMLAFPFGLKAGAAASLLALGVFVAAHVGERAAGDWFSAALQAGGVLMHGPVIGYLADRERRRSGALCEAGDRLAEANRRLQEEQAKLVQAEKLSSIGLLASGIAHEINNPLSGVRGCVRALREGAVPADRRGEYFETIEDGLERIEVTVRGLLDFARQRPPMATEQDAGEIAASCARLLTPLTRKKGVEVENRIASGSLRVFADRTQLMQAVVNVLMNAVHAVSEGEGRIAVEPCAAQGMVGIRVVDNGRGIPRQVLGKVCDPFFTTKPAGEGTGLGLAVTLGIARSHGGDLAIESEEGQGTTVTLWLPSEGREVRADA